MAFAGQYVKAAGPLPVYVVTKGMTPYPGSGVAISTSNGAAISCSGTVTDTYTWQPNGGNATLDPPPTKVLVQEVTDVSYDVVGNAGTCSGTATTGMTNETGAANDQQDDGNPTHQGMAKGSRHGEKWLVMAGGPSVTVVSPTMSVSGAGSARVTLSRNFTSSITPIYVAFTCTDTTTNTNVVQGNLGAQRCLIGMGITASVTIAPDVPPTFTPPSGTLPFKNYDITKINNDQLVPLDGSFAQVPHFFNTKDGAASVTCSGTVHGEAFTVTDVLTVKNPENVVWTVRGGTSRILDSQEVYGLFRTLNADPPMTNGIDWEATMSLPGGFSGATLTFPQKITMTRDNYYKSGQPFTHTENLYHGQTGLDGGFTFFGTPSYSLGKGGDTPQQGCNNTMSSSVSSDSFDTWLMFKPDVSDAAWVPLKTCQWSWSGTVTWNNGTSMFDFMGTSPPASPTTTDTSAHPQWNKVFPSPQSMVPVTAP